MAVQDLRTGRFVRAEYPKEQPDPGLWDNVQPKDRWAAPIFWGGIWIGGLLIVAAIVVALT